MSPSNGFEVVKRRRTNDDEGLGKRQLDGLTSLIDTILNPGGAASPTPSTPASSPTSSPAPSSPSSGGSTGGGGTTPPASSAGTGGTTPGSSNPAAPASGASSAGGTAANSAVAPVAGSTAAAAASAATPAAAAAAAAASSLPASALTTQLVTAANGTVATTVLPIGAIPSIDPFGNIVTSNVSSAGGVVPLSTILPGTGSSGSGAAASSGSDPNRTTKIAVPIAVIGGIVLLGLLIFFVLRRQRRSMERELSKPMLRSNKANLIAASTGALGFTAAGVFHKNRRGSEYRESSHGHAGGAPLPPWLSNGRDNQSIYDDQSSDENHQQTTEAHPGALMAGVGLAGSQQSHYHQDGTGYSSDMHQSQHRRSVGSGEAGYRTASEEGAPHGSFFEHGNNGNDTEQQEILRPEHYDGSAAYGYSGQADNGQALAPQAEAGQDSNVRASVANTVLSTGQAYDGAEIGENPFELEEEGEARPNPHYDGNRIMQHPHLNSSRWSG